MGSCGYWCSCAKAPTTVLIEYSLYWTHFIKQKCIYKQWYKKRKYPDVKGLNGTACVSTSQHQALLSSTKKSAKPCISSPLSALLQLHLSYQQFYCQLTCSLYYSLDDTDSVANQHDGEFVPQKARNMEKALMGFNHFSFYINSLSLVSGECN